MAWDADRIVRRAGAALHDVPEQARPQGGGSLPIPLDQPESLLFLDRAFRAVLDRPPDAAGLAWYGHLLASGADRSAVVEMLAESDEFSALVDERDDFARVRSTVVRLEAEARLASLPVVRGDVLLVLAVYEVLLGREPDGPGFVSTYRYLRSGGSLRRVLRSIRLGSEGIAHAGGRPSRRTRWSRPLLESVERTASLSALAFVSSASASASEDPP